MPHESQRSPHILYLKAVESAARSEYTEAQGGVYPVFPPAYSQQWRSSKPMPSSPRGSPRTAWTQLDWAESSWIRRGMRCVFRRNSGSLTFDVPPMETRRWRAVARVLRSPLDALVCALLPCSCALCGSPLPQFSSAPICVACWMEIPVQYGPLCSRCGDRLDSPLPGSDAPGLGLCRICRLAPPSFERAVAYGPYRETMRSAIHALKYDKLHPVARELGRRLALAIAGLAGDAPSAMLVIPVPLNRTKRRERGFNQASALATQAVASLRKTHPRWRLTLTSGLLLRTRPTQSQAGLTVRQRRLNMRGAFAVPNPDAVNRQHILLIDDIFTTGATARAASLALRRAGAASVWVATLARANRIAPLSTGSSTRFEEVDETPKWSGNALLSTPASFADAASGRASYRETLPSSHDQPSF